MNEIARRTSTVTLTPFNSNVGYFYVFSVVEQKVKIVLACRDDKPVSGI